MNFTITEMIPSTEYFRVGTAHLTHLHKYLNPHQNLSPEKNAQILAFGSKK